MSSTALALNEIVDKSAMNVEHRRSALLEVKEQLSKSLVSLDDIRPPLGLATGIDTFDNFLLWRGLPKGDLSLFHGKPGTGATSLWINVAQKIHEKKKWVAWINSDWELLPQHLSKRKVDLQRLLVIKKPEQDAHLFWILQELMTSSLFEMIGCHLQEGALKNHQLQKLKKLARTHQVALVIISHAITWASNPIFSLVIDCQRDFFTIRRALHRPTPFTVTGLSIHCELLKSKDLALNLLS